MFSRLTECLMSNILIVVEIVPGGNNFIVVSSCEISNQFLYKLAVDGMLWMALEEVNT